MRLTCAVLTLHLNEALWTLGVIELLHKARVLDFDLLCEVISSDEATDQEKILGLLGTYLGN